MAVCHPRGAEGERAGSQMARDVREGIFRYGEDDRDYREAMATPTTSEFRWS